MPLILFGLMLVSGAIFVMSLVLVLRGFAPETGEGTPMPTFRKYAYIVLIILLFGVTSGVLGMA